MIRKIAAASFAFVCAVALADGEFAPVAYRSAGETAFEVEVWGRTYRYENSVFPVSVRTAGREIFAAPMSFHAKFGEEEGAFRDWQYTLVRSDADAAVVLAAAHCSNVMVNAAITFERDGMVKTDLKLVPYGYYSLAGTRDYEPSLSAFWFDVNLRRDSSGLFHYWPNSANSMHAAARSKSTRAHAWSRRFCRSPTRASTARTCRRRSRTTRSSCPRTHSGANIPDMRSGFR